LITQPIEFFRVSANFDERPEGKNEEYDREEYEEQNNESFHVCDPAAGLHQACRERE
jgi:hypothetical protein